MDGQDGTRGLHALLRERRERLRVGADYVKLSEPVADDISSGLLRGEIVRDVLEYES